MHNITVKIFVNTRTLKLFLFMFNSSLDFSGLVMTLVPDSVEKSLSWGFREFFWGEDLMIMTS